jgi:chromosome partitioning protein
MPRRVAFINEKGGSGKTTLAANFAAYLAMHRGHRVLAVDMDPQGQLGKALGVDVRQLRRSAVELVVDSVLGEAAGDAARGLGPADTRLPSIRTRIENLDVIVANKALALFPTWTDAAGGDPTHKLAARLERVPELGLYDFVLFDAPPSFGPLTLNVLRACDEVVVPVPLTYLAADGCAELLRTLDVVRGHYAHPGLRISMVVPTFYRRTKLAEELLENLKQRFPKEISHTVVGFYVKLDEAQSHGVSIFEYAPSDRGARIMAALAEELEARGRPNFTPEGRGAARK